MVENLARFLRCLRTGFHFSEIRQAFIRISWIKKQEKILLEVCPPTYLVPATGSIRAVKEELENISYGGEPPFPKLRKSFPSSRLCGG